MQRRTRGRTTAQSPQGRTRKAQLSKAEPGSKGVNNIYLYRTCIYTICLFIVRCELALRLGRRASGLPQHLGSRRRRLDHLEQAFGFSCGFWLFRRLFTPPSPLLAFFCRSACPPAFAHHTLTMHTHVLEPYKGKARTHPNTPPWEYRRCKPEHSRAHRLRGCGAASLLVLLLASEQAA